MQRVRAAFQLRLAEVLTQEHRLQCRATATHTDVLKVRMLQRGGSPKNGLQGHQGLVRELGDQGSRQQQAPKCSWHSFPLSHLLPTGWVCV